MTIDANRSLSKEERDARLDELEAAVNEWGEKEKKRLNDELVFLKSVLKGRSGAGRLVKKNLSDVDTYLVDKISRFLEG